MGTWINGNIKCREFKHGEDFVSKYQLFKKKLNSLDLIVFYKIDLSISSRIVDPSFLNAQAHFFSLIHSKIYYLYIYLIVIVVMHNYKTTINLIALQRSDIL